MTLLGAIRAFLAALLREPRRSVRPRQLELFAQTFGDLPLFRRDRLT